MAEAESGDDPERIAPPATDVVIVGGGHNGLVAAAYLARFGVKVALLERLDRLGGAAVSERPFPGVDANLSRYSYLVSLMPYAVVRDLELDLELRSRCTCRCVRSRRLAAASGSIPPSPGPVSVLPVFEVPFI